MKRLLLLFFALILIGNIRQAEAAPKIDSLYVDSLFAFGQILGPTNVTGKADDFYATLGIGSELDVFFTRNKNAGTLYPILPGATITVFGRKTSNVDSSAGQIQFYQLYPNGVVGAISRAFFVGEGKTVIQVPDTQYTYVAITLTGNGTTQGAKAYDIDAVLLEEDLVVASVRPAYSLPEIALSAYPNPLTSNRTSVSFDLDKPRHVELTVSDMFGRTVYQEDLGRLNSGTHEHALALTGQGLYMVRLMIDGNPTANSLKLLTGER